MAKKEVRLMVPGEIVTIEGTKRLIDRVEGNAAVVWLDPNSPSGERSFGCGMFEEFEVESGTPNAG